MFAGLFNRTLNNPLEEFTRGEDLLANLDPLALADKSHWVQDETFLLAATLRHNTPESKLEKPVFRCPKSGCLIAAWARLDNRSELFGLFRTPGAVQNRTTDQELILAVYAHFGEGGVERLVGDFAFVIFDPVRQKVFAARDALGGRPFYYHISDSVFAFATTPTIFKFLKNLRIAPDPAWLARYLADVSMSHTATAFGGVAKLAPGHCLSVGREQNTLRRYFLFCDDAPFAAFRNEKWVENYRTLLEESHRCRLRSTFPIGSETSGGIDSSTVTAYAAKLSEQPLEHLHTFGFACCELVPRHILQTSYRWGIHQNHIFTNVKLNTPRNHDMERALRVLGYPEEHGSGIAHIPFYELCRQFGIRTLLSGFGGDEVVTNPGSHLRREMAFHRSLLGMWNVVPGNYLTRALRVAKNLWAPSAPAEFNSCLLKAFAARWPNMLVREDLSQSLGLENDFMEQARYDAPFRRINEFILENRINAPFVSTRLENCTLLAASYGVDYRWPLLDPRLIQQYLSTPAIEKAKGATGRYLHRRAVEDLVPPGVLWKSKDMGSPRHRLEGALDEKRKAQTIRQVQEQEGNLHRLLAELVDRKKLQQQIALARQGGSVQFWRQFRNNARHLTWLNHWLHGLG